MSRLFSITSSTSDATMLSAATMTIRPMVIEMATFSSHSAENSDWFICAQSWVTYVPPRRLDDVAWRSPGAAYMSSTRTSMKSGRSRASSRCAVGSSRKP